LYPDTKDTAEIQKKIQTPSSVIGLYGYSWKKDTKDTKDTVFTAIRKTLKIIKNDVTGYGSAFEKNFRDFNGQKRIQKNGYSPKYLLYLLEGANKQVNHTQTLYRSGIDGKNDDKPITAWKTSETEYDVRVPARYRQFTGAYRVHAIHRDSGKITHYVYRVDAKQLKELNAIIELIKKVAV
jgi:hypothetical protein